MTRLRLRLRRKRRVGTVTVIALGLSLLALVPARPAAAALCMWTGASGNHLFSDAGNWSSCNGSGGVPGSTDHAYVDDAAVTVDQPVTINQLDVLDGSTLTVDAALTAHSLDLLDPGTSLALAAPVTTTFTDVFTGASVTGAERLQALVFVVHGSASVTDTTLVLVAADPSLPDPNSEIDFQGGGELDLHGTATIETQGPTRILVSTGAATIDPAPTLADVDLILSQQPTEHYDGEVTATGASTIRGDVPSTATVHVIPATVGTTTIGWASDNGRTLAGILDVQPGVSSVSMPASTITVTGRLHVPLSVPTSGTDLDVTSGTLALDVDGITAPEVTPIQLSGHLDLAAPSTLALDVTAPICPGDELPLVHAAGGITLASTHVHVDGATGSVRAVPAAGGGSDLVLDGTGTLGPDDTCRSVDPNRDLVRRWYQDLLGRQGDTASVLFWAGRLDDGAADLAVARGVTSSPELARHQVTAEFERILEREPDAGGLAFWAAKVRSGVSLDRLRSQLAGSNEVWQQAGHSGDQLADILYERLLGRPVDQAGHDRVVADLQAGWSRPRIAASLLASNEAKRVAVTRIDTALLHRAPTSDELTFGVALLRGGITEADLAALVAASPAYVNPG